LLAITTTNNLQEMKDPLKFCKKALCVCSTHLQTEYPDPKKGFFEPSSSVNLALFFVQWGSKYRASKIVINLKSFKEMVLHIIRCTVPAKIGTAKTGFIRISNPHCII
jgi:hypothetical protein